MLGIWFCLMGPFTSESIEKEKDFDPVRSDDMARFQTKFLLRQVNLWFLHQRKFTLVSALAANWMQSEEKPGRGWKKRC